NVEKWGTGALNIDRCRIPTDDVIEQSGKKVTVSPDTVHSGYVRKNRSMFYTEKPKERSGPANELGRFPANCITLEEDQFYSKYFNITPKELSKKASKKDRNSDWQGNEIDLLERKAGGL